jgi:hypothetical protein
MLGSDVLDIAIGLIFVYLVLCFLCSAINGLIEGWLKTRAANLKRGIRELLADPNGTGLVKAIYDHALICGAATSAGRARTTAQWTASPAGTSAERSSSFSAWA